MRVDNFDRNKSRELSDSDLENISGGSKGGPVEGEYQAGDDGSTADEDQYVPKDDRTLPGEIDPADAKGTHK